MWVAFFAYNLIRTAVWYLRLAQLQLRTERGIVASEEEEGESQRHDLQKKSSRHENSAKTPAASITSTTKSMTQMPPYVYNPKLYLKSEYIFRGPNQQGH